MKLKLLGAAVATTFAVAAHAQSSVTLYGAFDAGAMYQSTSAASFSPTAPNLGKVFRYKDGGFYGSFWGMKGSEDLGGGYHVNFKLQSAFDSSSGKFGLSDTPGVAGGFNQFATVGISGPFGSVNVGRQVTPMIYAMAQTDVRAAHYFGSIFTAWIGLNTAAGWPGTSTNVPVGALYDSNAIVYQSPNFGGTTLGLEYAPGGVPGKFQGGTRESAVLKYANRGLTLAAVYYDGHDTNPAPGMAPTGINNNRYIYLGALYTFHNFSVSGSYSNARSPARSDLVNLDLYSAGLGYRFSPAFQITSGVYYIKDKNNSSNKSIAYAVGAEYSLSKRTILFGQVGGVNNKGTMTQAIAYGAPVAPGTATTAAMIGVRHTF